MLVFKLLHREIPLFASCILVNMCDKRKVGFHKHKDNNALQYKLLREYLKGYKSTRCILFSSENL